MTAAAEGAPGLPELARPIDLAAFLGFTRQAVHKQLKRLPAECFVGDGPGRLVRTAEALPLLRQARDPSRGRAGRPIGPGVEPSAIARLPATGLPLLEAAAEPPAGEVAPAARGRGGSERGFAEARERRERAQAELAELELERRKGELVEAAAVGRAGSVVGARLCQVLDDALEAALPQLRGAPTTDDARRTLPRLRDQVLAAFAAACRQAQRELTADA